MLSTPDALATVERTDAELGLEELRGRAANAEILLAEGFARGEHPRIEVMGDAANPDPRCAPEELIAFVASSATNLDGYDAVPRFEPNDTAGIADFIEEHFLKAGGGTAGN
jgi:molybdopterin-guanine dinucleotide biosynthesis protein